jgi:hypothetical protein
MSDAMASTAVWRTEKSIGLTGHSRHRHGSKPISVGFDAPTMCKTLTFGPTALAASIARTATLRNAPPEMLARWGDSALNEVEWLIEDGSAFALTQHIDSLADAERTNFAGRVGAGVTDLIMNALGYTWRDNASCLAGSLAPHPDFIYSDGAVSGHGVVLAEARGSFAANVSATTIAGHAKRKYNRQVKPHLNAKSPHGTVIHGYSIAFGAKPGTADAFLHAAETRIPKPRGTKSPPTITPPDSPSELTPASIALATHRSNFSLMDAPSVVAWIDWVRAGGERPDIDSPLIFLEIPYAGRTFLASAEPPWPFHDYPHWLDDIWHDPRWWPVFRRRRLLRRRSNGFAGWFVMEEKSVERFLNSLSAIIRRDRENMPDTLELPRIEHAGFAIGRDEVDMALPDSRYAYALYRDGLALLGSPPTQRITGYKTWVPSEGMLSD